LNRAGKVYYWLPGHLLCCESWGQEGQDKDMTALRKTLTDELFQQGALELAPDISELPVSNLTIGPWDGANAQPTESPASALQARLEHAALQSFYRAPVKAPKRKRVRVLNWLSIG
jgi:hypothetical protein